MADEESIVASDPSSEIGSVEPDLFELLGLPTRRELIRYGAAAAATVTLPAVLEACGGGSKPKPSYKPVSLTDKEMTTLKAALAQMFPNDALGPGAVEADVHVYIDKSLAGSYKPLLPVYQGLLSMFDTAAGTLGAKSFAALSAARQVSLLQQFEAGKPPGVAASDQATVSGDFQVLLEHMREGMFGDPMYGGNRDLAGWDFLGYPGVLLIWNGAEQTIGAKLPAAHKTAKTYGGEPYNGPPV